jgi:outer membrane protein
LNQWSLEAQLVVPISDYFLRINQAYSAATKSQEAARLDVVSARAKSSSDGKVAYYNWMRARGASVVAKQALEAARTHLQDAKNLFTVGSASKADVLRAETAVAGAELAVERTKNLAELTEKQVAVAIHAKEGEVLTPGEGVDAEPPPFVGALPQLVSEAKANRYEVKSIDANAEAAKKQVAVVRGGAYPSLGAFAQAVYADPNQRRFPQVDANGRPSGSAPGRSARSSRGRRTTRSRRSPARARSRRRSRAPSSRRASSATASSSRSPSRSRP